MGSQLAFEWDTAKAEANVVKHGLSFERASEVFADPGLLLVDTTRVVDGEARLKAVGVVSGKRLTVIFTYRGDKVRVISVRRANDVEEKKYDRQLHS